MPSSPRASSQGDRAGASGTGSDYSGGASDDEDNGGPGTGGEDRESPPQAVTPAYLQRHPELRGMTQCQAVERWGDMDDNEYDLDTILEEEEYTASGPDVTEAFHEDSHLDSEMVASDELIRAMGGAPPNQQDLADALDKATEGDDINQRHIIVGGEHIVRDGAPAPTMNAATIPMHPEDVVWCDLNTHPEENHGPFVEERPNINDQLSVHSPLVEAIKVECQAGDAITTTPHLFALQLFFHFLPYLFWVEAVMYTNEYADAKMNMAGSAAFWKDWKPVTVEELIVFIALTIASGLFSHNGPLSSHWATSAVGAIPAGTFGR